jgi:hypothetical protein
MGAARNFAVAVMVTVSLAYLFYSLRFHLIFANYDGMHLAGQVVKYSPLGSLLHQGAPAKGPDSHLRAHSSSSSDEKAKSYKSLHEEIHAYRGMRTPYTRHIVAVGDLHGDLPNARRVLKFSDVIDEFDNWSGNVDFFVQTGDIIDRYAFIASVNALWD